MRGLHPDSHSPDWMEAQFCSFPQDKSCELFWYMSCICKSFITDNFFTNGSKFYKLRRNSSKGEKIVQIRFWLLLVQSLFCRENGTKNQLTFFSNEILLLWNEKLSNFCDVWEILKTRDAVTSWRCDVRIALMKQIDFSLRFCFVRKISFFASFGLRTKKMNFLTNFWASWELGSFFTNGRFSFLWKNKNKKSNRMKLKNKIFLK